MALKTTLLLGCILFLVTLSKTVSPTTTPGLSIAPNPGNVVSKGQPQGNTNAPTGNTGGNGGHGANNVQNTGNNNPPDAGSGTSNQNKNGASSFFVNLTLIIPCICFVLMQWL